MAKALYFSGTDALVSGFTTLDNAKFKALFPGQKGMRSDSFQMRVAKTAEGVLKPITRLVFRSDTPSNHKCDARCRHAKGNQCECSCGGKFHGVER